MRNSDSPIKIQRAFIDSPLSPQFTVKREGIRRGGGRREGRGAQVMAEEAKMARVSGGTAQQRAFALKGVNRGRKAC